ncbi:hypothetical protein RT97_12995 [Variovorax paradoxus]|uniref:Uncharacterized protein n=1 Tax=Variovorax paradoxus TaxID=34073 RepID=A0A0D0L0W1_VARPD|nr:hypothetical protein [Variovorax paradoxus]KIQ31977.1 hypothetical protein RT97_12995 [Variovorax paradoxus]
MNFSTNNTARKDGFAFSLLRAGTLAVAAAVILSACGGGDGGGPGYPTAFLPVVPPADSGGSGGNGGGALGNVTCKDFDGNDMTVKPKTITVYNNSDRVIYPVLSTSENAKNEWIRGCFRVDDKLYPTTSVYKLYVNEGTGIPANSSVTVTLPLYSELSTENYITWWNGGRVVLADSNERLRQEEDKKLDTPAAVTCTGDHTNCALSVYSSKVQFPENIYAQLSEYTFGDAVIPVGQKPLLKPDNVGYNISYVDHVYLPIGIGPKNNPYIGYSGSVQSLPTFAGALGAFMGSDAGKGWPVYNLNSLKLPGGYNIFAQREGVVPAIDNVPVKPASGGVPVLTVQKCIAGQCTEDEKKNLHYGDAVQRMQNLWGSCVNWGAEDLSAYVTETISCPADLATKMDAVKQFFAQNHQNYLALHTGNTCKTSTPEKPVFTYMEALKHIYGWVPFNEGCGAGDNKLADTSIPGWTHATIQPMYIHDLQYNYKQAAVQGNPKLNFNPYVSLIHESLQMNAYGFSVDDAVGFMSELGDGLVFVVGGPHGLENSKQFSYLDGFALAIGVPSTLGEGTPLIKKYGVCALGQDAKDPGCAADKQDVTMPTNSRIAGFRVGSVPSYPVKVRFTDTKDNLYTFQVIDRFSACAVGAPGDCPSNRDAIKAGLVCSVTRSDGTVHPMSKTWCDGANPNQSRDDKDPQVTKNFMSFPMPVDFLK